MDKIEIIYDELFNDANIKKNMPKDKPTTIPEYLDIIFATLIKNKDPKKNLCNKILNDLKAINFDKSLFTNLTDKKELIKNKYYFKIEGGEIKYIGKFDSKDPDKKKPNNYFFNYSRQDYIDSRIETIYNFTDFYMLKPDSTSALTTSSVSSTAKGKSPPAVNTTSAVSSPPAVNTTTSVASSTTTVTTKNTTNPAAAVITANPPAPSPAGINITKKSVPVAKTININDIIIGIIDIDEECNSFEEKDIEYFYQENKTFFDKIDILVVCSQNSISLTLYQNFQNLLQKLLESKKIPMVSKKNSTELVSFISGSGCGLRTRVYINNTTKILIHKLDVVFNNMDFRATSSKEGAILCNIKYYGQLLINIVNSYIERHERYPNIFNFRGTKKRTLEDFVKDEKIFFCGSLDRKIFDDIQIKLKNNISILRPKPNNFKGFNKSKANKAAANKAAAEVAERERLAEVAERERIAKAAENKRIANEKDEKKKINNYISNTNIFNNINKINMDLIYENLEQICSSMIRRKNNKFESLKQYLTKTNFDDTLKYKFTEFNIYGAADNKLNINSIAKNINKFYFTKDKSNNIKYFGYLSLVEDIKTMFRGKNTAKLYFKYYIESPTAIDFCLEHQVSKQKIPNGILYFFEKK